MTLEQLYRNYSLNTSAGMNARALLMQSHWYSSICEFDPRTADALPQPLDAVLRKMTKLVQDSVLKDRLWRITKHVRSSLTTLYRNLNESPLREQAVLPLRAVRELDTASFMALARRPGRNVREKLAGKPYLQAVQRLQSVDLPENRLLKAFSEWLAELLELRAECLNEEPDELLAQVRSWLVTDEAQSIRRWDNLPPNNTLLSHRHYRAVYDAWRWLQSLDDDITMDFAKLSERQETMQKWQEYGKKYAKSHCLFADIPIFFDFEKFEIQSWTEILFFKTRQSVSRSAVPSIVHAPVCVDLTELFPRYAFLTNDGFSSCKIHPNPFLWQRWRNTDRSVSADLNLFNADAVCLHSDAVTVSAPDLFFSRNHTLEHLDCAARAFTAKLRETFANDTLFWLQPDFLNDFELEITRRNINARFPGAEPLPRSVAAVFEQVDFGRLREGFSVVVVDTVGGKQCAAKLEARFDAELEKRLPETYGFYWERHPPVILSCRDTEEEQNSAEKAYAIASVDAQGIWYEAERPKIAESIDPNVLRHDTRIGQFGFLINLSESPVRGGLRLLTLQKRAGDIPLWRDQIPELSIKVLAYGRYQRIFLVSRGTTVKPIRGQAIQIPVKAIFTLPAEKRHYQFPLFIGEADEALGFSAKLESPAFPLPHELKCSLNMTFTYGADDPYCLIFEPINSSISPIRIKWQRTAEEIITDAPAPEYPMPMTWDDLRSVPKPDSDETSDLLEWANLALDRMLYIRQRERTTGMIKQNWLTDKNGRHYTFVQCNDVVEDVFVHEKDFVYGNNYSDFQVGDIVSFELHVRDDRYFGKNVAQEDYKDVENVIKHIHNALYFPVIQIWRDGRSIDDEECPPRFRNAMKENIVNLEMMLLQNEIPDKIRTELLFLLSCMHKDAPKECIQWIAEQVESGRIRYPQAVGFALGDVSEDWQKTILKNLIDNPNNDALRVFSYAIWREPHFVEKFTLSEYQSVLNSLSVMLANIDRRKIRNWARTTAEPLELLLGLLRTRNSSDEDVRMLLQPHQKLTKELAKQVEHVENLAINSHIALFSRVQLDNLPPKQEDDRTPDLLYALRLYLTGDDGANAIQITGVLDGDTE